MATGVLAVLIETAWITSAAMALVLALRRPLRRRFGATIAYAAWWLVPVTMLTVLLPAAPRPWMSMPIALPAQQNTAHMRSVPDVAAFDPAPWILAAWCIGAITLAVVLLRRQHRFMRRLGALVRRDDGLYQSESTFGLPAAIGLLKPRVIVPADFDTRYSQEQQALIRTHERSHIERGDLYANAAAMLLRCVYWFNPLLWFAERRFRHDQELACDLRVLTRHPHARRSYGEAMVKTVLMAHPTPLGCHWAQTQPLMERIAMLKQPLPSPTRLALGAGVLAIVGLAAGFSAWASQPGTPSRAPTGVVALAGSEVERVMLTRVPEQLPQPITASEQRITPRQAALQFAAKAGIVVVNPDALANDRTVSFGFDGVPAETAFNLLGAESGVKPVVNGNQVLFVPRSANDGPVMIERIPAVAER